MSSEKKTQTPNQRSKIVTPDALTKTTKKGDVELREEELKRTTGGVPIRSGGCAQGRYGRAGEWTRVRD
jgi:hypothetical protein